MLANPDAVVFSAERRLQRNQCHVRTVEDKKGHVRVDFQLDRNPFVQAGGDSVSCQLTASHFS